MDEARKSLQKLVDAANQAALRGETPEDLKARAQRLARHCARYRQPSTRKAIAQLASTLAPFLGLLAFMAWLGDTHPLAIAALAVPLGGLLVRCFIIQHDCGHGSFVASKTWCDVIGRCLSVLTVTPYALWRRVHAQHHAASGNLGRRGAGDIKTLTVEEYLALDRFGRLRYRIYRNPAFLFLVGVPAFFTLAQRLPWWHALPARQVWRSVMGLNLALVLLYGGIGMLLGFKLLGLIAAPAILVASVVGGWLFFIQHQFEHTHWEQPRDWDFQVAAVQGSSYYALPAVLNWFTGNIGLHHIHHLNCMIPNYRLRECLLASLDFQALNRITFLESLTCARLALWDETRRRLIGFRELRLAAC
jgi:omega-6 fatty acid desaturase (delta-12 desaturase)